MEEIIVDWVDSRWPYAAFEGTSMSAPMATGIVALMLEANPTLSKDDIVDIFQHTAREDGFTGSISPNGSTLWGYGKIDAHEAVKMAENYTAVSQGISSTPIRFQLSENYPNPFNPVTTIRYGLPRDAHVRFVIYDIRGNEIEVLVDGYQKAGFHSILVDASKWASGVYVYRVVTVLGSISRKMILQQ